MTSKKELFSNKLKTLQARLGTTQLLIVSKTRSLEDIQTYYELGHRDFAENRVQDLVERSVALKKSCPEIRWHMIGHLQSNKINQLFSVQNPWAIHSVDSQELLEKLIKSQDKLTHSVNVFLQYNTSKEDEKSGFEDYASLKAAAQLLKNSQLKLYGLMTMGTIRTENVAQEAKRCFQELNGLKNKLGKDLGLNLNASMGMSQDYEIAVAEKSDWVRIGTMMFTA